MALAVTYTIPIPSFLEDFNCWFLLTSSNATRPVSLPLAVLHPPSSGILDLGIANNRNPSITSVPATCSAPVTMIFFLLSLDTLCALPGQGRSFGLLPLSWTFFLPVSALTHACTAPFHGSNLLVFVQHPLSGRSLSIILFKIAAALSTGIPYPFSFLYFPSEYFLSPETLYGHLPRGIGLCVWGTQPLRNPE